MELRPHFKTHQSADVGNWFRDYGVTKIAVSSLDMAIYFANQGWDNITVAFPYNPLEWEKAAALSKKIKLNILVESQEALNHAKQQIKENLGYFIKLDVGYHRTGVNPRNIELIEQLQKECGKFQFEGILAHAGHSYNCRSKDQIIQIYSDVNQVLIQLKDELSEAPFISYGDTPTCSVVENFSALDEMRCGNFVYYDLTQVNIGSCNINQVAVAMACPVVAHHLSRDELVIYGGAIHFSKDSLKTGEHLRFGQVVHFEENGWELIPETYLTKISQEHGIIHGPPDVISKVKFGDTIGVIPVHSCLASDLSKDQRTLSGEKINKLSR